MAGMVSAASRLLRSHRVTRSVTWGRPSSADIEWIVTMMGETSRSDAGPVGYVTVPAWSSAAAVLPALSHQTLGRALVNYNALRPPHRRILRRAMAAGLRWDLLRRVIASPVNPPATLADGEHALSVTEVVSKVVDRPVLLSATLRATDPTRKPVFQAIDDGGAPVAFVKVGWNERTKLLLQTEADALARCEAAGPSFRTPRHLYHGAVGDIDVLILEPLPVNVRRYPATASPPLDLLDAIVHLSPVTEGPLRGSPYVTRLRERVGRDVRDDAAAAVTASIDHLVERRGDTVLRFGAWHGDCVRWNLARHGRGVFVWDWEFFDELAPVGFDAAHFSFEPQHIAAGCTAADAVAHMHDEAPAVFEQLGVGPEETDLSLILYLIEALVRIERIETARSRGTTAFRDGLVEELGRLCGGTAGSSTPAHRKQLSR